MVDAEGGLVKVVDFGIARKLQTNASRFTQGLGTPNYMAPELFMGQMDYRSDIYAIGAVFYELLSYQKAFEGDTPFAVIGKIVLEKPAPLADICPGVDPAIVEIVNKALEKEPAQRYQDLDEMRADIKRVAASLAASDTASSSRADRRSAGRRCRGFAASRSQVVGMGCRGRRGGRDRIRIGHARLASFQSLGGAFGRLLDQNATVGCRARLQEPLGACRRRLAVHGARGNVDH